MKDRIDRRGSSPATRLALALVVLAIAVSFGGCARVSRTAARPSFGPGAVLAAHRVPAGWQFIGALPIDLMPTFEAQVGGSSFRVGVSSKTGKALCVQTTDSSFTTAEGVRVGMSLRDVRSRGARSPRRVAGSGYAVALPSGWNATFYSGRELADEPLTRSHRVAMLFAEVDDEGRMRRLSAR